MLIIDAENEYEEGKKQNKLLKKHIEKIVKTFHDYTDVERFARVVDLQEIKKNDWNLNIRRYVDTSEPEEEIDVKAVLGALNKLEQERKEVDKKVADFISELGYE